MKKLLVSIVGLSLVLTALSGCGPRDEKQAFIDATIDATCYIFEAEDIFDPAVEEKAKEIYAKYGFDVEDEAGMEAIALKYSDDEIVQAEILAGIEKCTPEVFNLPQEEEELIEEDPAEEEPAEEDPAEEDPAEEDPAE